MPFRIETRSDALFASRYAAVLEEQRLFGYHLGSWVFSGESDPQRAEKARAEILNRNKVNADRTTRYVVETMLGQLDDSAWRWYDWATKWAISYTNQEIQAVQNGQKTPEEYQRSLNGLIENLISQVNQASAIQQKTQAQENWTQWTPEQLQEWTEENRQGDRLQGSKFVKNNVVYTYENGWTIVKLEDPKDYEMVGEELGNCTRNEAPDGWKNWPGMFALVDPEGDPKAVARFGGHFGDKMNICYEFQSFDKKNAEQRPATEYRDYLFEFLNNTTPEQFGFEGKNWENQSPVGEPHEIVKRYEAGERDFAGANLEGASLTRAELQKANLEGANLEEAYLLGADLQGADLGGANLRKVFFRDANLRLANLQDANLQGANLRGASLTRAELQKANLEGANLQGANLRGADFQGANLEGADLWGAQNLPADIKQITKWDEATKWTKWPYDLF